MRISDWSSDVCASVLFLVIAHKQVPSHLPGAVIGPARAASEGPDHGPSPAVYGEWDEDIRPCPSVHPREGSANWRCRCRYPLFDFPQGIGRSDAIDSFNRVTPTGPGLRSAKIGRAP